MNRRVFSQPARRFLPAGESMMDASAFFAADASARRAASASASATTTAADLRSEFENPSPSIATRNVSGRSSTRTPAVSAANDDDDDDAKG